MIGTGFWIDGLQSQVASMEQRVGYSLGEAIIG
jgi:methyl-accepting chemotaxis protein